MKFGSISLLLSTFLFPLASVEADCAFPSACEALELDVDGVRSDTISNEFCDNSADDEFVAATWFSFVAPNSACVVLDYDIRLVPAVGNEYYGNVKMSIFEASSCDGTKTLVEFDEDAFGLNTGAIGSEPRVVGTEFTPGATYYGALDTENDRTFVGTVRARACNSQCPLWFENPFRWMRCSIRGFYFPGPFSS